jgi:hypothetical protein
MEIRRRGRKRSWRNYKLTYEQENTCNWDKLTEVKRKVD